MVGPSWIRCVYRFAQKKLWICHGCKNYVMAVRIIINLRVKLLVECTILEVACLVTAQIFVYITFCKNCGDQYLGSTTDFKARFRIHKSDIKTKKDRCGSARHFNNMWCERNNPHIFLQLQLIESVQSDVNLEGKLWESEKYWQRQLFPNTQCMNSVSDLYSSKRKGYRKN